MGMMETKDLKWIEPDVEELKKITVKANEALQSVPVAEVVAEEAVVAEKEGALAKMKRIVRKAVNCCIE